jgi:hypothetical protein
MKSPYQGSFFPQPVKPISIQSGYGPTKSRALIQSLSVSAPCKAA